MAKAKVEISATSPTLSDADVSRLGCRSRVRAELYHDLARQKALFG